LDATDLEYSNEVWNGGFSQCNENYNIVVADQAANNVEWSILNFDGAAASNLWTGAWRRIIYQAKLISDDFRAVYGDSAMPPNANATVRPLIEFQAGNGQATGSTQLQFLDSYFNNSDGVTHVATAHPVNYFLWGGGGATYYNSNNDAASTVNALFSSGLPNTGYPAMVQADTALVKGYGLKRVAYEGGWGVYNGTNGFESTAGTAAALAKFDSRATTAQTTAHTTFQQSGGDLNIFYTSSNWAPTYIWSLTDAIFNLTRPLFLAATTIEQAQSPAITYGNAISGSSATTLSYGSQLFTENNYNSGLSDNGGIGFIPLISTAGNYQISVNINSATSGKSIRVLLDGQTMTGGLVSVPVSKYPVNVVVGTVPLIIGQHGLIIEGQYTSNNNYSGTSCTFTSVSLNLVSSAPAITSDPPPATDAVGAAYSFSFTAAGSPAPIFTLSSGTLPPGLTLSSNGLLSGTPTQAGTYSGTVAASNDIGASATQSFTITITNDSTDTPTMPLWGLAVLIFLLFITAVNFYPAGKMRKARF